MKSLFSVLFLVSIYALTPSNTTQQRIIQLHSETKTHQFEILIKRFIPTIKKVKTISKDKNIHLYEWKGKEKLLKHIQSCSLVVASQANKKVSYRNFSNDDPFYKSIPNDLFFDKQWQLWNSGQNSLLDADIDALEAWRETTGGLTATRDTIVVAVIDGGIDLEHPDLVDNIWKNHREINNNGIDDDGNGYIDDYYGWNFKNATNDVGNDGRGHWHGAAVAGIIGARGDNKLGVTGINWQVKIMNIVGGSEEATILEAYDYVLQMRKRYNETNGKEGAFVVVTNASFGIDGGQPEDSPLWCEMYNTLGELGVLSIGATSNQYVNVDVVGDLPTTCTSEYLISVTNSNNYDEFAFAGYGKEHIDLAAPGSGTYTVANMGRYASFGGTSAAAPHVAGAVALLYSIDNQRFAGEIKINPERIAEAVKSSILNGVDKLEDLRGKTKTEGRLNLFNSLYQLQEHYYQPLSPTHLKEEYIETVYPNPTNGLVNIIYSIREENDVILSIRNSQWKTIYKEQYSNIGAGIHKQSAIIPPNAPSGIYFLHITIGKDTNVKKIVKI